jgi:hypothetical protein
LCGTRIVGLARKEQLYLNAVVLGGAEKGEDDDTLVLPFAVGLADKNRLRDEVSCGQGFQIFLIHAKTVKMNQKDIRIYPKIMKYTKKTI